MWAFFTSADVAVKYPARSCPAYFRETGLGFYFDFALHLSINGYLESGCGLLESICRRWKRRPQRVEKRRKRRDTRRVERQAKTSVLIPYSAAKTEHWRNFCRKDESCDTKGAIEGARREPEGRKREWGARGNCDRKEGNWSGKRAPLVVAFSDNSRRTF